MKRFRTITEGSFGAGRLLAALALAVILGSTSLAGTHIHDVDGLTARCTVCHMAEQPLDHSPSHSVSPETSTVVVPVVLSVETPTVDPHPSAVRLPRAPPAIV